MSRHPVLVCVSKKCVGLFVQEWRCGNLQPDSKGVQLHLTSDFRALAAAPSTQAGVVIGYSILPHTREAAKSYRFPGFYLRVFSYKSVISTTQMLDQAAAFDICVRQKRAWPRRVQASGRDSGQTCRRYASPEGSPALLWS